MNADVAQMNVPPRNVILRDPEPWPRISHEPGLRSSALHPRSSAFICFCLFAGAAGAQEPAAAPVSVRYKCDNKQSLQVDYNIPGKTSRAIVTTSKMPKTAKSPAVAGKSWTMKQVVAASGIRFEDSKKTMQWWSKGAEGTLSDLKTNESIHCTEYASSR
jgi:membrane-bound inhibitor of C-type lysozyme